MNPIGGQKLQWCALRLNRLTAEGKNNMSTTTGVGTLSLLTGSAMVWVGSFESLKSRLDASPRFSDNARLEEERFFCHIVVQLQ